MEKSLLENIAERLDYAEARHPEGASMLALLDEVSEARYAQKNQDRSSYTSELLDVIVVAIRLIKQEGKREPDSATQLFGGAQYRCL